MRIPTQVTPHLLLDLQRPTQPAIRLVASKATTPEITVFRQTGKTNNPGIDSKVLDDWFLKQLESLKKRYHRIISNRIKKGQGTVREGVVMIEKEDRAAIKKRLLNDSRLRAKAIEHIQAILPGIIKNVKLSRTEKAALNQLAAHPILSGLKLGLKPSQDAEVYLFINKDPRIPTTGKQQGVEATLRGLVGTKSRPPLHPDDASIVKKGTRKKP